MRLAILLCFLRIIMRGVMLVNRNDTGAWQQMEAITYAAVQRSSEQRRTTRNEIPCTWSMWSMRVIHDSHACFQSVAVFIARRSWSNCVFAMLCGCD